MSNAAQATTEPHFDPKADAEYKAEAIRLIAAFAAEIPKLPWGFKPAESETCRQVLAANPRLQALVVLEMFRSKRATWQMDGLKTALLTRELPYSAADIDALLKPSVGTNYWDGDWDSMLRPVQRYAAQGNALTNDMTRCLRALAEKLETVQGPHNRKLQARIAALLGEDDSAVPEAKDAWAVAALADMEALPADVQLAWKRVFAHALKADGAKPTAAWLKAGVPLRDALGDDAFRQVVIRWFGHVSVPAMETVQHEHAGRTWEITQSSGSDANISILKGLAWMCSAVSDAPLARALASLVEATLRKQPGTGPWAVRAATAGIWSLTQMEGPEAVAQLGRLKTKVTFKTALNAIESGLEAAAKRAGVTKADLEDLCVPSYGFDGDGTRRELFGDCSAVATITPNGDVEVAWFAANGKPVKSPPASVKKDFPAELKGFKADVDAAGKMLAAQKARFDGFYLPERVWRFDDWQSRILDHPLLGHIARRLIWHFSAPDESTKTQALWSNEAAALCDFAGRPLGPLSPEAEVRLWHPIGFAVADVIAWRDRLQDLGVVQPFKQAYREIYLLTEAELRTNTYSNRFAGHILKQHQMHALAAQRGWRNRLRLMVDDSFPPAAKELPALGLRVEFWIEGVGENYATDATESGAYLYVATDQVRFYRLDAPENYAHAGGGGYAALGPRGADPTATIPLTEVPALAFSEIMRDIDLFVGVASVGNDPTWQDGGPQGQHADYWSSYAFGDLSGTAQTRREVLARLVPRLKIAERLELSDRFLIVRGDLRTYKIHLGSGNILMEPNDQYLCIVQDRSASLAGEPVGFLPFEGDQRLALILSKAFLLAADTKITDPTITRQLKL